MVDFLIEIDNFVVFVDEGWFIYVDQIAGLPTLMDRNYWFAIGHCGNIGKPINFEKKICLFEVYKAILKQNKTVHWK